MSSPESASTSAFTSPTSSRPPSPSSGRVCPPGITLTSPAEADTNADADAYYNYAIVPPGPGDAQAQARAQAEADAASLTATLASPVMACLTPTWSGDSFPPRARRRAVSLNPAALVARVRTSVRCFKDERALRRQRRYRRISAQGEEGFVGGEGEGEGEGAGEQVLRAQAAAGVVDVAGKEREKADADAKGAKRPAPMRMDSWISERAFKRTYKAWGILQGRRAVEM